MESQKTQIKIRLKSVFFFYISRKLVELHPFVFSPFLNAELFVTLTDFCIKSKEPNLHYYSYVKKSSDPYLFQGF